MDITIADLPDVPIGHSVKIPHAGCSNSAAMVVTNGVDGYLVYCHKCGETAFLSHNNSLTERVKLQAALDAQKRIIQSVSYALPEDFSHSISSKGLAWLGKGGWTCDLIEAYGIGWSEELQRVILPLETGFTARAVYEDHFPKYLEKMPIDSVWKSDPSRCIKHDTICITEDVLSAGRAGEFIRSYSLCGTSVSTAQLSTLYRTANLVLWLDPDKAGISGIIKSVRRLQLFYKVKVIRDKPEPKHLTNDQLRSILCT